MMQPPITLDYARPLPRRMGRLALGTLAWGVLTLPPLTFQPFRVALEAGLLDGHFLCCHHPEVAYLVFVVLPLAGVAMGITAVWRLTLARGQLRGWIPAVAGILLGMSSIGIGWIAIAVFKA